MGLQDELEPILSQIRSEADKSWQRYLTGIPDKEDHAEDWQKITNEFFGTVDDLQTRFRRYYAFDAHDFSVNVSQLASPAAPQASGDALVTRPLGGTAVGSIFSADDNYMSDVGSMIHAEQWNGPTAQAFHNNFLKPFERAAQWQQAYVLELATAAAALQLASNRSKRAIKFVAESCLGALKGENKYQGDLGFADTSRDLPGEDVNDGVGILLGVVGLFITGPVGTVVGIAGLASGIYGAAKVGGTEPYLEVEYRDAPQSVISQTEIAIKNLDEWILDQDEVLASALKQDLDSDDAFASPNLRLPPPGVTTETYKSLGIRDAPGGDNQVVVSIVNLARAGSYNLPGAAYEYDLAANQVDACEIPGVMGTFFPRSIAPFNDSVDRLVGILRNTSDSLTRAGDLMLTAARNYRGTDAEQSAIITEISKIPQHHTIAPTK
ncbi:MAG: hypothetical protein HOV79_10905 [Hamadaea sp.]|nr:hypothetical protein [Hamadaea sp.]